MKLAGFTGSFTLDCRRNSKSRKICRQRTVTVASHEGEGVPKLELMDCWLREPNTGWGYYLFEELNFEVSKHEVVLVVGENGVGKSTLMDILAGFVRPTRGKVLWDGKSVPLKQLNEMIGCVFQFPANFFIGRTILDELIAGRSYVTPDRIREIMREVGLFDTSLLLNPRNLSGGQKRRLALASQLVRYPLPQILLLDEPLAGVDRRGHRGIVDLINRLREQMGIVIVTHDPGLLLSCTDRMVQLAHKRVWEVPNRVLQNGLEIRRAQGEFEEDENGLTLLRP